MRKSLGNKRNYLNEDDIKKIIELYDKFEENKHSKIYDNAEFGYTKVIVERPLQLNYQVTDERLENIYSLKDFSKLSESKKKNIEEKLKEEEAGKKKQEEIINALKTIGNHEYKNWGEFQKEVKDVLNKFDLSLTFLKNIILALSEHDETADYVLYQNKEKMPDSNLRDTEKIPLKQNIKEYFEKEVKPYYTDAWMDRKKDKVGYEINFTKYFYEYKPPRALADIEKDIKEVTTEIQELIKEEL